MGPAVTDVESSRRFPCRPAGPEQLQVCGLAGSPGWDPDLPVHTSLGCEYGHAHRHLGGGLGHDSVPRGLPKHLSKILGYGNAHSENWYPLGSLRPLYPPHPYLKALAEGNFCGGSVGKCPVWHKGDPGSIPDFTFGSSEPT